MIADQRRWRPRVGMAAVTVLSLLAGAALVWFLRPGRTAPPAFTRLSFHQGEVVVARFAPDGKAVVYSARLNGTPLDTYVIREEYPEPVPVGLHGAALLSVSRQGQMAVLVHPQYGSHRQWLGTLATVPIAGGAPRELLENVFDADWSADGNDLAVIAADRNFGKMRIEYPLGKVLFEVATRLTARRLFLRSMQTRIRSLGRPIRGTSSRKPGTRQEPLLPALIWIPEAESPGR